MLSFNIYKYVSDDIVKIVHINSIEGKEEREACGWGWKREKREKEEGMKDG